LLLFFALTKAQVTVSYSGNVTGWSDSKWNEFQFRKTSLFKISIPLVFSGAWFTSIAANVNSSSTSSSGLFGSVYAGLQIAPTSALAFYTTNFDYSNINYYSFDVSASAGFIGTEYISITEKSGNTVVNVKNLKNLIWTLGDSQSSNGLHYVTIKGTEFFSNFQVIVTFISSDNVGYVNYQNKEVGAIVTPKTIESIVEINNYPYKSSSNYLSLTMGSATGSFNVVASASASNMISGSGDNQVYFALSNDAIVDGNKVSVAVSSFATVSTGTNSYIEGQAKGKYGGSINVVTVSVDFPAGATNIVYDPTIGQGTPPTLDTGISAVAIFFIILGIVVFVGVVVLVSFLIWRKLGSKSKRPYMKW